MTDNETFLNDELRLAEDSAAEWNRRALRAEAQLQIAMEALEEMANAALSTPMKKWYPIRAREAISKINALKERKETP